MGQLTGDYNVNGTVDAADYVVWRKGSGGTFTPADYGVWRANFGATGSGGAGSPNILNETKLLSNSTLAANSSISLGNAFKIGGMQDLVFSFGSGGQRIFQPVGC